MHPTVVKSPQKQGLLPEKTQYTATKTLNSGVARVFYGARYLDPKTSRWISADPAMGEYIPQAPINDEVKKRNGNLPGMGGVFNHVNFHVYHYAGNNPVKLVDPDGRDFNFAKDASQKFKENFNIAMNYLAKSPIATRLINAVKNEMNITVRKTVGSSQYDSENLTIKWNDKEGLIPAAGGGVISSARGLIHEIAHAYVETEEGKELFATWKEEVDALGVSSDFDYLEEFCTFVESIVGTDLGEKAKRKNYNDHLRNDKGNPVTANVPDPTFHTDPPTSIE